MHGYIGRQTLSLLFFQEDISQKVLFLFAAGEIVTVQEDPARTETAEDLPAIFALEKEVDEYSDAELVSEVVQEQ